MQAELLGMMERDDGVSRVWVGVRGMGWDESELQLR